MARLSLFIPSDGSVCQIWVFEKLRARGGVRKRGKKGKPLVLVSLLLGLNYTAEPGRNMCLNQKQIRP